MNKIFVLSSIAGISALTLVVWLVSNRASRLLHAPELQSDKQDAPQPLEQDVFAVSAGSTSSNGVLALFADDVSLYARCDDGKEVFIKTFERNPQLDEWEGQTFAGVVQGAVVPPQSTSYTVKNIRGRQSHELLILGYSAGGETIIERWVLSEHTGSQFVHVTPSGTAIGVPQPPLPSVSRGIVGGGPYVPMANRPPSRRLQRVELFRQNIGAEPTWMLVDPEDRYVIFATQSPTTLYQWKAGGGLTTIGTAASFPLLSSVDSIGMAQHGTQGRLIHLIDGVDKFNPELMHLIFADADNDGVFETSFTLTQTAWVAQGYDGVVWYRTTLEDWTLP